jgi:hypothetical protein
LRIEGRAKIGCVRVRERQRLWICRYPEVALQFFQGFLIIFFLLGLAVFFSRYSASQPPPPKPLFLYRFGHRVRSQLISRLPPSGQIALLPLGTMSMLHGQRTKTPVFQFRHTQSLHNLLSRDTSTRSSTNSPTNLDKRLTHTIARILDEVFVEFDVAFLVEVYHRGTSVLEGTQTFSTSDLRANLNARVILDTAHQHCSHGYNSDSRVCARALDNHDTASVFAKHV